MTFHEIARDLVERGCFLFPCRRNDKPPAVAEWQAIATQDMARIDLWIDAGYNLGVSTSRLGENEALLVVDIDVKETKNGFHTLAALELEEGLVLPPTFTVDTPSGGRHLYYRVPEALGQGVNAVGLGVDTRSRGGFVVAPGSVIGDRVYIYRDGGDPIHPAPAWLVERLVLRADRQPERRADDAVPVDPAAAALSVQEYLARQPGLTDGDGSDAGTFNIAAWCRDLGATAEQTFNIMFEPGGWNERNQPPFDDWWVRGKIENAFRYGKNQAGSKAASMRPVGTPEYMRQQRGLLLEKTFMVDKLILDEPLFYLFAGAPRAGKSFFVLQMALDLASGLPFLDRFACPTPRRVLYVSLEDTETRLDKRLALLGDPETALRMRFLYEEDLYHPDKPPIDVLGEWLASHEHYDLVVVDTLYRLCPPQDGSRHSTQYAREVGYARGISKFVRKHRITLLAIHHTTKRRDESDQFQNEIIGSNGLLGGTDCNFILKRKEGAKIGGLRIISKDSDLPDLKLLFSDGRWTVSSAAAIDPETRAIAAVAAGATTAEDVGQAIDLPSAQAGRLLSRLAQLGTLVKTTVGKVKHYRLPGSGVEVFGKENLYEVE